MSNLSTEHTFLALLPLLFVLTALVGALIFLPKNSTDERSRASEPTPTIVRVSPTPTPRSPETVCSQLYSPVCGINGQTYSNECEAGLAGVQIAAIGTCPTPTPSRTLFPSLP